MNVVQLSNAMPFTRSTEGKAIIINNTKSRGTKMSEHTIWYLKDPQVADSIPRSLDYTL